MRKDYSLSKSTDKDGTILEVKDRASRNVFRMPLNYELIFATISCTKLWVLEQTPYHLISTDVELETGKAVSYRLNGDTKTQISEWSYDKMTDSWNLA